MGYYRCTICGFSEDYDWFWICAIDRHNSICELCKPKVLELKKLIKGVPKRCLMCGEVFPSGTQLHKHLRDEKDHMV